MIRRKIQYNHLLFWTIHTLYIYLTVYIQYPQIDTLDFFILRIFLIISFYINALIVFDFFFIQKSFFKGVLSIVLSFLFYCLLRYLHHFVFLPAIGHTRFYQPLQLSSFLMTAAFNFIEFALYALGYWYFLHSIKNEKKMSLLSAKSLESEKANLALENQKIVLEYNLLKAQINPHFLYNTIGFFHSKAMMFSKETAKGLELLSSIMRYSLQPGTTDSKVPLRDEVTHLYNYIELHQIRYENQLNIDFKTSGHFEGMRIPPHVLITLVENAFKHGIFNANEPPLSIHLSVTDSTLYFSVVNKVNESKNGVRKESSGIGLNNIRSRLEKEYGSKSRLTYKKENGMFSVELNISAKENDV